MGHIQVAAGNDGLTFVQLGKMVPESFIPFEPVVDAGQPRLGIGGIAGHKEETGVFQRDEPSLGVQLRDTDAVLNGLWLLPGENRRAGIAFFLGIVPELRIAGQGKVNLTFL